MPAASGPSTISEGGGDLLQMLLQDRVSEQPSSLGNQPGVRRDDVALVEDRSPVPHKEHAGHAERVLVGRHDGEETSGHDEALQAALAEEARYQVGSARVLPEASQLVSAMVAATQRMLLWCRMYAVRCGLTAVACGYHCHVYMCCRKRSFRRKKLRRLWRTAARPVRSNSS